ncbi:hypothetical protein Sme01_62440 [Sphaerisporangium melleum]|uniref:XRE family transcriptional regulator n=1 Tax=Sphaerisporangium melleum TaxID=321316 RepID=A0A917R1Z2_9ACTN|nr:hypothetical protein [Sphaerisporangium melleum]GGK82050.1 hypothetical protein GCM10007964_25900 [Sphaerisporangium melleum]GII73768.1 hypothetical protein Sme01_62440 [Sphaerisporangium melleum]
MEQTVLRQLAHARGLLAYRQFLRAYQEEGVRLGFGSMWLGPRQWKRWLAGDLRTAPYPNACAVLESMFHRPVTELLAPATSTGDGQPVAVGVIAAPVKPREIYEMMMEAADQSREAAEEAELQVGPATMEQLHDDVVELARTYLQRSPMEVFPLLVAKRAQILARRNETARPGQLQDLNFMAGVASVLLAEASIDLGQTRDAVDHARAAWSYANSIDNVPLAVWARGMMATSAYWSGRARDAVTAITRAEQHRPVGIAAARVYSIAARAYSHLGDTDRTVAAIHAAMEARSADRGGEELQEIGGVFDWDAVREQRGFSSALLQLLLVRRGEFDPAAVQDFTGRILDHTRAALADARALPNDQRSATVEATIGIEAATAFVILGDLANAHDTLAAVLELPENMRTFPVVYRLKCLHEQLGHAQQTQQVRALNSQLMAFMDASTVRALPAGG